MEEITAYKTTDGEEFLDEDIALNHEAHLKLKGKKEDLLCKVVEKFEKELTVEDEGETVYFENFPVSLDDIDYVDEFVDFATEVITAYNGKVLDFINEIRNEILEELK